VKLNGLIIMRNFKTHIFLLLLLLVSFELNARVISVENNPKVQIDSKNSTTSRHVTFNVERINVELRKTNDLILHLTKDLAGLNYTSLDSSFSYQAEILNREAADFRSYNPFNLSKFFLNNIFLVWSNYRMQFGKWQTQLTGSLDKVSNGLNRISEAQEEWKKVLVEIEKQEFPNLEKQIKDNIKQLNNLEIKYKEQEKKLVSLDSRISDKAFLCDQIISETVALQDNMRKKTFSKTENAIWNIQLIGAFEGSIYNKVYQAWINNYNSTQYYLSSIGLSLVGYLFWFLIIVFVVFFLRKKYLMLELTSETPGHTNIVRVLVNHPYAVVTATSLLLWSIMFPFIPLLLNDSLLIGIIISLSIILQAFIDQTGRRVLTALMLLLFLNVFELVFWYLGDYVRLYLALETGIALFIVAQFYMQFRENKKSASDKTRIIYFARKLVPLLLVFYIVAFFANIFGFVNLTVLLAKVGIRSVAMTMVAYGYLRIFETISIASLSLLEHVFPSFSQRYNEVIKKRTKRTINVIVFFLWFRAILTILEAYQEFMKGAEDVLTTELQIGSISISLLNILMFIIILSVTYLIAIFIKKILENEILRSLKLPRGMPAAVSMMLRIFFVTLGVIFAISAAGIDMGKFGMIAGALGVGIGFGLQNIVQNFISGLILIFERPIQVGDTVEVNNLLGKVKDIGVRASNVLTYDGAEVVVPNSNLISNDLINWTLSDSRKRVEIKVGTAYGTDPNEVLEILKNVAMSHSMVVQNPEPLALFDGFGDSSLDFRLLFWVNFEFGLTTKSDIAIGIYNKFAENNIEIPFPQIDMHVKDIAETKKDVAKAKKVKSDKVIEPRIEKGNPDLLESDDS
jgi:small-conductance mechanosensitive channel